MGAHENLGGFAPQTDSPADRGDDVVGYNPGPVRDRFLDRDITAVVADPDRRPRGAFRPLEMLIMP